MWPFDPVPDTDPSGLEAPHGVSPIPASVATAISGFGKTLIVVGLVLLAFTGFQLWGTGIAESRAQEQLTAEFESAVAQSRPAPAAAGKEAGSDSVPTEHPSPRRSIVTERAATAGGPLGLGSGRETVSTRPSPEIGDPIGRIIIPAIDVEKTIVEGTNRDELRSGPGHYPTTPLPGQPGNAAIAGHRTTHGAPFFDIDRLQPGDEIAVETTDGTFTYVVEGHTDEDGRASGHLIVEPEDVSVIANKGDDRLTLTACHPKYSADQRIIVTAILQARPDQLAGAPEPAGDVGPEPMLAFRTRPAPPVANNERGSPDQQPITAAPYQQAAGAIDDRADPAGPSMEESLGWQPRYTAATVGWALVTGAVALAAWAVGALWRRAPAYAMAVPPFGLALFHCFTNLEHLIPAV